MTAPGRPSRSGPVVLAIVLAFAVIVLGMLGLTALGFLLYASSGDVDTGFGGGVTRIGDRLVVLTCDPQGFGSFSIQQGDSGTGPTVGAFNLHPGAAPADTVRLDGSTPGYDTNPATI